MSYKRKNKEFNQKLESLVTPSHGHPLFPLILEELKNLHSSKNKDYANKKNPLGNFIRTGKLISKLLKPDINRPLAACMILMAKQIDAVYDMVGENKIASVERLHDKFRDISVYSIIAMIILTELEKQNKDYMNVSDK